MSLNAAEFTRAGLSDDEATRLAEMLTRIEARSLRNRRLDAYYEGAARIQNLGISVPPEMTHLRTVVGWPTMAVDVLEERLDILAIALPGDDDLGLNEQWRANQMDVKSGLAHTDTLIYGLNFAAASMGDRTAGEPEVLNTVEPPTRMTGQWNARSNRLDAAASMRWDHERGRAAAATLYMPNWTVFLSFRNNNRWVIDDIQEHRLGRVPVVVFVNRPRSGRPYGTSQISKAIISYTDSAVRTLLGMEVAREFYSAPQRYALNVSKEAFVGANGQPLTAWEAYLGRVWASTRDPNDPDAPTPVVGQFNAASPAPFVDQVKSYASLVSAEAAIPVSYMGFNTDNPPSGDGMRMLEARLIKRAERVQTWNGAPWVELNQVNLLLRDGELSPAARKMSITWRDAATPTRSATADQITKYVSSSVLRPTSRVTREQIGFDAATIARLEAEDRQAASDATVQALLGDQATPAA